MASPAQMDRNRIGLNFSGNPRGFSYQNPAKTNDSASFAKFVESKPKQTNDSASFANYLPQKTTNDSASFANFIGNQNNQSNNNQGIQSFQNQQSGGSKNIAQQVLGFDAYSQALNLGYQPSQLIDMVTKAQGYNRGIDVDKFKTDLNRFQGFQESDGIFKFDDPQDDGSTVTKQYLSVSRPELSANAPTLAQLLGDIGGGISNMVGAGADFMLGGGAGGQILRAIQEKFNQGKDYVGRLTNPGDIMGRLDAFGPEVRRKYFLELGTGIPYQQAFERATGQKFESGGITTL